MSQWSRLSNNEMPPSAFSHGGKIRRAKKLSQFLAPGVSIRARWLGNPTAPSSSVSRVSLPPTVWTLGSSENDHPSPSKSRHQQQKSRAAETPTPQQTHSPKPGTSSKFHLEPHGHAVRPTDARRPLNLQPPETRMSLPHSEAVTQAAAPTEINQSIGQYK